MQKHIRSVHEGLKFRCSFCNKTSSEKNKVRKHILALHGNNPDAKTIEIKSITKSEPVESDLVHNNLRENNFAITNGLINNLKR